MVGDQLGTTKGVGREKIIITKITILEIKIKKEQCLPD
jgi:hypothetical protein